MLSLSKLMLLSSDETEGVIEEKVSDIDSELDLVTHEEDIPESVLVAYGYDASKLRVMTPSEIIKVCIISKYLKISCCYQKLQLYLTFSFTFAKKMTEHRRWTSRKH